MDSSTAPRKRSSRLTSNLRNSRLSLALIGAVWTVCTACATTGFAQEEGSAPSPDLTEKLLRKAEVERIVSDKTRWRVYEQGNPIPRTKSQIPEPPPKPPPPVLSDEELRARIEEAKRNAPKPFVIKVLVATVFDGGYTELEIFRNNQWFKAIVNADLSLGRTPGILETEDKLFCFIIMFTRSPANGDIRVRSAEELSLLGASTIGPLPRSGERLGYVVGYDPKADAGGIADYEIVDALLDHYEAARDGGSGE